MKQGGHNFHPSRISGHQKFLIAKAVNEDMKKNKKQRTLLKINPTKSDWYKQVK